jgi:hypothetical protein
MRQSGLSNATVVFHGHGFPGIGEGWRAIFWVPICRRLLSACPQAVTAKGQDGNAVKSADIVIKNPINRRQMNWFGV